MKCDACGADVTAGAAFCSHCGARMGEGGSEVAVEDRSAKIARLTARGDGGSGKHPVEEELWSGTYSPKALIGPTILVALMSVVAIALVALFSGGDAGVWIAVIIGLALVWLVLALVMLYRRMTVRYRLTTYRLFHEIGLLSRTRDRIEVIDINDVTLTQGVIERLFGVGTIHVVSSDVTHGTLHMPGIEDARRVTDLIDDTRRAERHRRGLFMENIGPAAL
jgi:membrane protein YdbS with pleckstrin-like domain